MTKVEHPGFDNITQAIKDKMIERNTNNVAIFMPGLDNPELKEFRKRFKKVSREPFGYMRFEV